MASKEDPKTFKSGDLVVLKSGGPVMTVNGWNALHDGYYCQWFGGKKLESGHFKVDSIKGAPPEATL